MYKEISYNINLGESSYCETCGSDWPELNVTTTDFKIYDARSSIGCYGGGSVYEVDLKEVISFIKEYEKFNPESAKWLIAELIKDAQ